MVEITYIENLVRKIKPAQPLHIIYKNQLINKAKEFINLFSRGTIMYAVKSNPDIDVIKTLYNAGVNTFDAASIVEVRLVRKHAPNATIHFMHTVKSREAIKEAYFKHNVRVFVFDTADELQKILDVTKNAPDLKLFVRIALPKNMHAAIDFSVKFGATPDDSVVLLQTARKYAAYLGVMFHAGTQSSDPDAFARGVKTAAIVIKQAGVKIDAIDVGGGFPVPYPGRNVPPLERYINAINATIDAEDLGHLQLFAEPGRALVAESGSLIVRVELRKGNALYLNDGLYGGLIEMLPAQGSFSYPFKRITKKYDIDAENIPFCFCGPTCDSYDMMAGPFMLPSNIKEGDWIEIGMAGAYSIACRTNFNGFGGYKKLLIDETSV